MCAQIVQNLVFGSFSTKISNYEFETVAKVTGTAQDKQICIAQICEREVPLSSRCLSYDRSIAPSKASSPQSAI
jgi:hypothetical protein